jgi:uncharacterized OsmC-like protein
MTSKSKYLGNLRTENEHGQSKAKVLSDAPIDNHGKGEAFSPTDLVATALASCMLTMMGIIGERENLNLKGMTAETTKTMASSPRRISKIKVGLKLPDYLSQEERELLENTAKKCPVHFSLHPDIEKDVQFNYEKLKT